MKQPKKAVEKKAQAKTKKPDIFTTYTLVQRHAKKNKLSPSTVLMLLYLHGNDYLRVTDIADAAGASQQSMGKKITDMAGSGIIKTKKDKHDTRVRLVSLTGKGNTLVKKLKADWG